MTPDLEKIFGAYVECALWASTDDAGRPMDDNYGPEDISPEAIFSMRSEVVDFVDLCKRENVSLDALNDDQVGHDFWLTRNGHGAGFWDRGLGDLGDELTKLAKSYGESNLYVGDDGKVYAS